MTKRIPDFFIIGAPKAGTTAMSEYLRRHPDILFSEPKEPYFFNDDFSSRYAKSYEDYLKCFSGGTGGGRLWGEGSVFYLFSQAAVSNILNCRPDAKFIVMLRNPIDAAYSMHWQALFSTDEDILDFEEAWRAQVDRQKGVRVPRHNKIREALMYGPLFKYGEQLTRLYNHVARERIHIVLFEDFVSDPGRCYADTLDFLGLRFCELPTFGQVNRSKRYRSRWLMSVLREGVKIKKRLGVTRELGIMTRVKAWNTKHERRPPLSKKIREELRRYFDADIRKTEKLIGRDLSAWRKDR